MTMQQDPRDDQAKVRRQEPLTPAAPPTPPAAGLATPGTGPAAANEAHAANKQMQAGGEEWMHWAQSAFQANLKAWQALLGCDTVQTAIEIQSDLVRTHLKLLKDSGRGMAMPAWKTGPGKGDDQTRSA